jgi:translation elongation factor EF-4
MAAADPERVAQQMASAFDIDPERAIKVSRYVCQLDVRSSITRYQPRLD